MLIELGGTELNRRINLFRGLGRFNRGLALIGFRTTGNWFVLGHGLSSRRRKKLSNVVISGGSRGGARGARPPSPFTLGKKRRNYRRERGQQGKEISPPPPPRAPLSSRSGSGLVIMSSKSLTDSSEKTGQMSF